MIVDGFIFSHELDLLECRLATLDPVVDRFILCEAPLTFQGRRKPLYYADNRERFSAWSDKITHVVADLPHGPDVWGREYEQRDAIARGLVDCDRDDILMLSDVDEIPRPELVAEAAAFGLRCVLEQRFYSMAIDWQYPDMWPGTIVAPIWSLIRLSHLRMDRHRMLERGDCLRDAGWHFSWLGDLALKMKSFSHTELVNTVDLDKCRKAGVHVDGDLLTPVDVDETWPVWMQNPENVPANWLRPR